MDDDVLVDLEKFRLTSPPEISQILKSLAKKAETVAAYYDDEGGYMVTAVIAVKAANDMLVLDRGPDVIANLMARRARRLSCEAKLDQVDVRFECGPVSEIEYEGKPAFRTAMPESVLRLQRREYFRVPTLVSRPVTCTIPFPEYPRGLELVVGDMSLGGLGVLDPESKLEQTGNGAVFRGCKVMLPDFGDFSVDLEVRNVSDRDDASKPGGHRVGLSYRGFPRSKESLLQRYINHLQLRARGIERG